MANINIQDGIISSSADYSLFHGTTKVADVEEAAIRVQGDIIAENYIVSSSTTYMTTSFSDGSTIFGDNSGDTHQFTGSLLITGSENVITLPQQAIPATPTLAFGDGDSGFYEASDDQIRWAFGGSEQFRFDAGGIFGGSNGNPYMIDEVASATNPVWTFTGDTNTGIGHAGADTGSLIAGGTNVLNFRGDGNAGIGTVNATTRLTVLGSMDDNIIKFGAGSQQNIALGVTNDRDSSRVDFFLATEYGAESWSKRVTVTNQGKVGIGTVDPPEKLSVNGVISASSYIYATDRVYMNNHFALTHDGTSTLSLGFDSSLTKIRYGKENGNVHQFLGNTISGSSTSTGSFADLHIPGKIGVGTTSPLYSLHVEKAVNSGWVAQFKNTGTTNAYGLQIDTTANTGAGEYSFAVYTGAGTGLFVTSDANVGIGDSSPSYKLDVDGTGRFTGNLVLDSDLMFGSYEIDLVSSIFTMNNGDEDLPTRIKGYGGTHEMNFNENGIEFSTVLSGSSTSTGSFGHGFFDSRLGIGTLSPGDSTRQFEISSTGTGAGIRLTKTGGSNNPTYDLYVHESSDTFIIGRAAVADDVIFKDGSLGISTTPTEKLHVAGNIFATGNISGSSTSTGSFGRLGVGIAQPTADKVAHFHGFADGFGYIQISDANIGGSSTDGLRIGYNSGVARIQNFENSDMQLMVNTSTEALRLESDGSVTMPTANATLSGSFTSTGSFGRVNTITGFFEGGSKISDYVFEDDYNLRTLDEVETHISQSKHLPGIPSEANIQEWRDLSMGDKDRLLLEKIEELTLYTLQLNKRIEELERNSE